MANVTGLNVSPYLSSALSRIQANDLAAGAKSAGASASSSAGRSAGIETTNVLSDQTLGALVAMQAESNSGS
jgi:hypothetical protein